MYFDPSEGPGAALLFDFYLVAWKKRIHRQLLDVAIQSRFVEPFDTLSERLLGEQVRQRIGQRIARYKSVIAPRLRWLKIAPLLPNDWQTLRFIDLGAGTGALGDFVSPKLSLGQFISIDPHLQPRRTDKHKAFRHLNQSSDRRVDIALFCFSLHHMSELDVESYFDWASSAGCRQVIVLEDSFPVRLRHQDQPIYQGPLDDRFRKLSTTSKLQLYLWNDYVSNVWMYRNDPKSAHANHRTAQEWISLFVKLGAKVDAKRFDGFDFVRLHGVPSVAFSLLLP